MTISTTTTIDARLSTEVKTRVMIGIFIFLVWQLSLTLAKPGMAGTTLLLVNSLVDVLTIAIMPLLFNGRRVAQDANELNCYSLIFHLIYFPMYFYGAPETPHNYAINGLMVIFTIRLLYFGRPTSDGDYAGFPPFGPLGFFRQWQAKGHRIKINLDKLPAVLFFGSLAPLSFIAYRTNDMSIGLTVAALMTFIYIIANQIHQYHLAFKAQASAQAAEKAALAESVAKAAEPAKEPAATTPADAPPRLTAFDHAVAMDCARQIIADYKKDHNELEFNTIAAVLGLQYFVEEEEEEIDEAFHYDNPGTQHPYLEQFTNPGKVLHQLLQFLPEYMQETGAFDPNEALLADAIAYQATQAHQILTAGVEALKPLLPATMESDLRKHADLCRLMAYLTSECEATDHVAGVFRGMVQTFCSENPHLPLFPVRPALNLDYNWRKGNQIVNEITKRSDKHFYFPLAALLQSLPSNITQMPRLTQHQHDMCLVLSVLAGEAKNQLACGISAVDDMLRSFTLQRPNADYTEVKNLLLYLKAEQEFMHHAEEDYQRAGKDIKIVG